MWQGMTMYKIYSFVKSIIIWAYGGFKYVNEDKFLERLTICNPCNYRKGSKCEVCGCYLKLKAKMASEHCPKGYW